MDKSTNPSGCAAAVFIAGRRLSQGNSGNLVTGAAGLPPEIEAD